MIKTFKLFIERPNMTKLITEFTIDEIQDSNLFSTFNENISFQEHDQINFTFSVMKFIDDASVKDTRAHNELLKLLTIGTTLKLVEDNYRQYNFIIKSIEPGLYKRNACYNFTCQDEISYKWSKLSLGYSYSTIEKGGPRNILLITQEILSECYLDDWAVVNSFSFDTSNTSISNKKITFEISDSNPYNAIIEAANSINAQLSVNYANKTLTFFQKNNRPFSGYRYRPELNLSSLGVTYNSENMASILHVYGGSNENGSMVSMIPYMPKFLQQQYIADKSWENTYPKYGWYSDPYYPTYFRHVQTQNEYLIFLNLYITKPTKDNPYKNLTDDMNSKNVPKEFYYSSADDYWIFLNNTYRTFTEYNSYIDSIQDQYAEYYLNKNSVFSNRFLDRDDKIPSEYQKIYPEHTYVEYNSQVSKNILSEIDEYRSFIKVANQQQHLGQFLFNFDFFKNSKLMSETIYTELFNIFNKQMRNNNIWLKIYTQDYYDYSWELYKSIQDFKLSLEQAYAMYSAIKKDLDLKSSESIVTYHTQALTHINSANALLSKIFNLLHIIYGDFDKAKIPEFNDVISKLQYYQDVRDVATLNICDLNNQIALSQNPDVKAKLTTDLEYYKSRYESSISMCGEHDNIYISYTINDQPYSVDGMYYLIKKMLIDEYNSDASKTGIYKYMQDYEFANKELWKLIYQTYGTYIYEQKYENTDELDSLSLYNQAIGYYEDYNKPNANYNIEVLSLNSLECVSLPQVKVGYRIKVYNDYLNLNDDELNNIQFTNNELIITNVSYELRKSQQVSIGVEQVTQYQTILQKLIKIVK